MNNMVKHGTTLVCSAALALFTAAMPSTTPSFAQGAKPAAAGVPAGPAAINSSDDLILWMTYYYAHPQPDLLVPALKFADSTGLVDKGQAPLTAFVSRVFASNPQKIAGWTQQLSSISNRSKPMLWSALWWSNTIEGKDSLEQLMKTLTEAQAAEVLQQMAHPATPIEQMEVKTPEVLDELWGAFSATGDEKYVDRLISVLPWQYNAGSDFNKMTIGSAARWSLTSNCQQHPAVLKICQKAKETKPELKSVLDKIIADAAKNASNQQTGQSGPAL